MVIDAQMWWCSKLLHYFLWHAAPEASIAEGLKKAMPVQVFDYA
jgi:hypothetical protein